MRQCISAPILFTFIFSINDISSLRWRFWITWALFGGVTLRIAWFILLHSALYVICYAEYKRNNICERYNMGWFFVSIMITQLFTYDIAYDWTSSIKTYFSMITYKVWRSKISVTNAILLVVFLFCQPSRPSQPNKQKPRFFIVSLINQVSRNGNRLKLAYLAEVCHVTHCFDITFS